MPSHLTPGMPACHDLRLLLWTFYGREPSCIPERPGSIDLTNALDDLTRHLESNGGFASKDAEIADKEAKAQEEKDRIV